MSLFSKYNFNTILSILVQFILFMWGNLLVISHQLFKIVRIQLL